MRCLPPPRRSRDRTVDGSARQRGQISAHRFRSRVVAPKQPLPSSENPLQQRNHLCRMPRSSVKNAWLPREARVSGCSEPSGRSQPARSGSAAAAPSPLLSPRTFTKRMRQRDARRRRDQRGRPRDHHVRLGRDAGGEPLPVRDAQAGRPVGAAARALRGSGEVDAVALARLRSRPTRRG